MKAQDDDDLFFDGSGYNDDDYYACLDAHLLDEDDYCAPDWEEDNEMF